MMRFYVDPGTRGRYADTLQFIDDRAVTHTVAVSEDVDHTQAKVTIAGPGIDVELYDVDDIARHVARLLVACRGQSLVVNTYRRSEVRGDENDSADVYPPHAHPAIVVKGK